MQLFHYTTRKAIKSIIENHELWLTRSDCFEDANEFIFLESVIGKVVCSLFASREAIPWALQCYLSEGTSSNQIGGHVLSPPDVLRLSNNVGFVLSMSSSSDNDFLWDEYCDSSGSKMALVLDGDAMISCIGLLKRREIRARIETVSYGEAAAVKRIEGIITGAQQHYCRFFSRAENLGLSEKAAEDMNRDLEYMIEAEKPFFKGNEYEKEKEVRLLLSLPDEARFSAEAQDGEVGLRVFRSSEGRWRASLTLSDEWFSRVVVGVRVNKDGNVAECGLSELDLHEWANG